MKAYITFKQTFKGQSNLSERGQFCTGSCHLCENGCLRTVVLEKTLQSPLNSKEIKPVHPKGTQPWMFTGRINAEALILWPPDAKSQLIRLGKISWERLKAGEGGGRGWDGWTASPTQWTWVWANSRRYWRTEETGVLQSMGSQRVRHDLATEWQQQIFRALKIQWHQPSGRYICIHYVLKGILGDKANRFCVSLRQTELGELSNTRVLRYTIKWAGIQEGMKEGDKLTWA